MAFCRYGTEQIARTLEEGGVLTSSCYRNRTGGNIDPGYRWSATTIAKILRDQRYCGDVVNLKTFSNSYKDKKRHMNAPENIVVAKNVHESIVDRVLWEYIQCRLGTKKMRKKAGEQSSLFSGFLRCGDCDSNLHYHFNQANPKIEYYNCSNYVGNRGTCPNTHYVRLDAMTEYVLAELNHLIRKNKDEDFWQEMLVKKDIQTQEELTLRKEELQCNTKRQEAISNLLRIAYEDKVKGVIDEETFALLSDSYKQERTELRTQEQQLQDQLEVLQNGRRQLLVFQKTLLSEQTKVNVLTRDSLGLFVDWIAVYPADRSVKPYKQKIEIHYHFIGKL